MASTPPVTASTRRWRRTRTPTSPSFDYKLDSAGKHSLFLRGNLQNDSAERHPAVPGTAAKLGDRWPTTRAWPPVWTGVLTPTLVSTFHYGFTRAGNETTGVLTSPYEWFRGLDTPFGTSTGSARIIPVHTIGNDLSWNKAPTTSASAPSSA